MAYWWERYDTTPVNNSSPPPDGAPEDHFPDQVNNIQRQNMAAVAEIGEKVLGAGDGSTAPQSAVSVSGPFLKLIYDALLPINTIMAWDSKQGANTFQSNVPDFPEFASVDWQRCDATGTGGAPDLSLQAISGANFVSGPDQNFTGDQKAAEDMGLAGEVDTSALVTGAHKLTELEMPIHKHSNGTFSASAGNENRHNHDVKYTLANISPSGSGQNVVSSITFNGTTTGLSAAQNDSGSEHTHDITGDTDDNGNDDTHTHDMDTLVIPDHIHTVGQPASAALEYYIRVA